MLDVVSVKICSHAARFTILTRCFKFETFLYKLQIFSTKVVLLKRLCHALKEPLFQ